MIDMFGTSLSKFQIRMSLHDSVLTDRGFSVHDRSGLGGSLPAAAMRRGRSGWSWLAAAGTRRQVRFWVVAGPRLAIKPEDSPSFSRHNPLSLRLENGLLQHRTRVPTPKYQRKKARLGFFSVV